MPCLEHCHPNSLHFDDFLDSSQLLGRSFQLKDCILQLIYPFPDITLASDKSIQSKRGLMRLPTQEVLWSLPSLELLPSKKDG